MPTSSRIAGIVIDILGCLPRSRNTRLGTTEKARLSAALLNLDYLGSGCRGAFFVLAVRINVERTGFAGHHIIGDDDF